MISIKTPKSCCYSLLLSPSHAHCVKGAERGSTQVARLQAKYTPAAQVLCNLQTFFCSGYYDRAGFTAMSQSLLTILPDPDQIPDSQERPAIFFFQLNLVPSVGLG